MPKFLNTVFARDTTDCTGINTGGLQVAGGAYFAKRGRFDGQLNVADTTASTSYTSGAFTVGGGVGVSGDIYSGGRIVAGTQLRGNTLYVDGYAGSEYFQATTTSAASLRGNWAGTNYWGIGPGGSHIVRLGMTDSNNNFQTEPTDMVFQVDGTVRSDAGFDLNPVPRPTYGSASPVLVAGNVDVGLHYYRVTFLTASGETNGYGFASATTDATHGQVQLTLPVSSDARVTARKVYRTKAGGQSWDTYALATIADNTTLNYTDNTADASLGASGGYYQLNTTSNMITVNGAKAMVLDILGTAFGIGAGQAVVTGGDNVFFGYQAGNLLSNGSNNVFLGAYAGALMTAGTDNIGIGWSAGGGLGAGGARGNVFIGRNAGISLRTSSSSNIGIGQYALGSNSPTGTWTGNTAIGQGAGYVVQGNYNTYLGYYAGAYETGANKLIIDSLDRVNEAQGRSNALIYGIVNTTAANQSLFLGGQGITTITSELQLAAGTTSRPSTNVPDGAAPSTPTKGDVWAASGHLYYYDGSTAKDLTAAAGGMTNPMTTLGDIIVGGASGTVSRLAGNTTTTPQFLKSLGSAGLATAPSWAQISASDLSDGVSGTGSLVKVQGPTFSGARVNFPASAAGYASLRLSSGVAVSSPASGDIWNEGNKLRWHNGSVIQALADNLTTQTGNGATSVNPVAATTARITLTGDATINMAAGGYDGQRLTLELVQDASGGHSVTIGTGFAWGADITSYTPTTTANKVDYIGLTYNSTASAWRVVAISKGY